MTTAPATIPLSAAPRPAWTVTGTPPRDAIAQLATLCLDVARRRLAERAAAGDGDVGRAADHDHDRQLQPGGPA